MIRSICVGITVVVLSCTFDSSSWSQIVITSPSELPDAVKGEAYSFQLEAEGAVGDVTWEVETGDVAYVEIETPHYFAGSANATRIIEKTAKKADVPLPFDFPFYGKSYRKLLVSSAGHMGFIGIQIGAVPEVHFRLDMTVMACLMSNLYIEPPAEPSTGDGVYAEVVPWRCVITWKGKKSSSNAAERNFQGIIYPGGGITFNYGDGNHNLDAIIGISAGDGGSKGPGHYLYSMKNGATDLEDPASSRFMLSALPPQLELDGEAGILSGTPTESGTWAFRVLATDSGSGAPSVSKVFTITVPGLSIDTRPGGVFIRKGEPGAISWGGGGIGDTVTVRLYRGGELVETILDNATNEEGVMWQPPDEYELSDDYSVVVEDNSAPPLTDTKPLTIWDENVLVPQCCATIQEAVAFGHEGDTALIAPGTYVENILVKKKITLAGAGGGETVLDGGGKGPAVTIIKTDGVAIRDVTVTHAGGDAVGGIYCADSGVTIERCKIEGNSATFGGGVFLDESVAFINECEISGNSAEQAGGGLYAWASKVVLADSVVKANVAPEGGGIFCWYSVPQLVRTVIAKNEAERGAGIFSEEAAPVIVNCTIADNSASDGAGGVECQRPAPVVSVPVITNSIVWGNGVAISGTPRMKISYSDVEDDSLAGASGNLFGEPLFVDAEGGDYHLAAGSPCIDAGDADALYNDGDGSRCDMGAFGGTGYVPKYAWISHLIITEQGRAAIYWLATAFTECVGQFADNLLSGWSAGVNLDPEQEWTPTSFPESSPRGFFRVQPIE